MSQAESASEPSSEPSPRWLDDVVADLARIKERIDRGIKADVDSGRLRRDYDDAGVAQIEGVRQISLITQIVLNERMGAQQTDATAYYRLQTLLYAQLATQTRTIAESLAIDAVRKGFMSRVQAAEILGVHQGTVARWVKQINESSDIKQAHKAIFGHTRAVLNLDPGKVVSDERLDSDPE